MKEREFIATEIPCYAKKATKTYTINVPAAKTKLTYKLSGDSTYVFRL